MTIVTPLRAGCLTCVVPCYVPGCQPYAILLIFTANLLYYYCVISYCLTRTTTPYPTVLIQAYNTHLFHFNYGHCVLGTGG